MGCKELIDSLRKSADDKIRSLWQEAEAGAERIKAETSRRIEEIRVNDARMLSSKAGEKTEKILWDANNAGRMQRLSAEKALSDRVFSLALSSLRQLRNEKYKEVFEKIVHELPPRPWQSVRVNPQDIRLAEEYFPGAEIIPDGNITGGVDAMIEAGKIRVINTFEKRLERAWEDIFPELMKVVFEEAANHGTSRKS
jgi:V/A-type H+-transporting ATPase subunit E